MGFEFPELPEIGDLNWGPVGLVAALGVMAFTPAARRGLRTAAVKATALGIAAANRLKGATSGAREGWSSLVEEARAERNAAQEARAG